MERRHVQFVGRPGVPIVQASPAVTVLIVSVCWCFDEKPVKIMRNALAFHQNLGLVCRGTVAGCVEHGDKRTLE